MSLYQNKYRVESARWKNWVVVMPNHIHGILILTDTIVKTLQDEETLQCNVSTDLPGINQFMSDISPKSGLVSTIFCSYKSVCTQNINVQYSELNFAWQSHYHDRVIWDGIEYQRIANYIINNLKNWNHDKSYQ